VALLEVVVFEEVKPTGEKEEVGSMKRDPAELEELVMVAFQAVVVSVVMFQVRADRVEGKEVASAMYANPELSVSGSWREIEEKIPFETPYTRGKPEIFVP